MERLGSRKGRKRARRRRTNTRRMGHADESETYAMAIGLMLLGGVLFFNGVGVSIAAAILPTVSNLTVITIVTLLTVVTYAVAGVPRARQELVRSWILLADAITKWVESRARRNDPNRL